MSTALNVYKSKLGEIPNWGFTYQVFYIKTRGPGATLLIWVTKAITNQKRFDHLYSIKYKISTQFLITSPLKGTWINLKALSLGMICAKFCWNCPVVLEMKMKSVRKQCQRQPQKWLLEPSVSGEI